MSVYMHVYGYDRTVDKPDSHPMIKCSIVVATFVCMYVCMKLMITFSRSYIIMVFSKF